MSKVFVVTRTDDDRESVIKIFSSEEKANIFCDEKSASRKGFWGCPHYDVLEIEVE